ncbi:MAG TPA: dethiobiotin synthase [Verrucomicrobiae bacterium]|jgi:dethiobiotin synthetase|nr:dethiobiotin synthase [Verrucomicrobiae bacterium]
MTAKKIIFVTGTDTGVGKTLLSALLLHHLRQSPGRTLAMKPFCSGGLGDVRLLQALQPGELSDREMNPYYFSEPIAPFAAAGKSRKIRLPEVVSSINHIKKQCDRLIIEGSGGLLVPLGENFTVANLIAKLDCQVVVAARNKLGTINHTLLTINVLKQIGINAKNLTIVLMSTAKPDLSSQTNLAVIKKFLPEISVFNLEFFGANACSEKKIRANHLKVEPICKK